MSKLRIVVVALFALLLPGLAGALAADQSSPAATVRSWLAAVEAGDKTAALALGTAEWAAKETSWDRSFTTVIFDRGYRIKSAYPRDPEITGATATLSVSAIFLVEGQEDNEGLRFSLELRDGSWVITDLS